MNKERSSVRTPIWVLVAKGWFFGTFAITLPFLLLFALSLPFVETETGLTEIILAIFVAPIILSLQSLLISLIVVFGLKVAVFVGMQKDEG